MAQDRNSLGAGPDAPESLARRVRDAASQRLHLLARRNDREFQANDGTVVYSIDTDIVYLHLDPADARASSHEASGSRHYTHVFEKDSDDLSIALGKRITEFIFYRLGNQAPTVMLAPLQREVARVFEGIARDAGTEQTAVEKELHRLGESIGEVDEAFQQAEDESKRLDLLLEHLPALRSFLFGFGGPSVKLSRLDDLLGRSPLVGLDRLLVRSPALPEATRRALARPGSVADFIDYNLSKEAWKDRLTKTKSATTPGRNIDADCEVLAWLETVNAGAPGDLRVVHVTGDRAIFDAARSYPPGRSGNEESFAQRYLRDPRAFLAEPEVFFGERDDGRQAPEEFVQWLNVFLGKFTDESSLAELVSGQGPDREVVERVLDEYPKTVEDFDARWKDFCGPMALDLAAPSPQGSTPWDQYRDALVRYGGIRVRRDDSEFHTLDKMINSLRSMIDARVNETWRECFRVATSTGFELLHTRDGSNRSRYAAAITFPGYPEVSAFFSAMLRGVETIDRTRAMEAFDDAPQYVFYLVFAGLFGAEGRWRLARVLAERALAAVPPPDKQSGEPGEKISGREAYYLKSFAGRLTARNIDALQDAEDSLDGAYAALATEHKSRRDHPVTNLRFDAERVAFRVSRCLLLRFQQRDERWAQALGDWRDDTARLLARVDAELAEQTLQDRVRVALETNYLMCLILTSPEAPARPPSWDAGDGDDHRLVLRQLEDHVGNTNTLGPGVPYLVRAVLLAARAALDPPDNRMDRRRLHHVIDKHFATSEIEDNRVTVYDPERFRFLREFAELHLEAAPQG